ncbi:MAG: shikimate dehydrogenase [Hyphomicrobiales bacterium]|nr:shikimate dehydrogenase [Hyphomicrobiales bacterium]MBV9434199.1 shikimate dehydrogenase [Hyphomicrobiales bacterium]
MKRACVIGDPVAHSRSPLVHGFWLAELGIEGSYGREQVSDEALAPFIRGLRERGYVGCNVTLPHKEAAFHLMHETTELARSLAAVNTIWFDEEGRLHGDNTDVHGFIANLDQEAPGWRKATKTALVLGAGGAARAVVMGLAICGVERVIVANRSTHRTDALVAGLPRVVQAVRLDRLPQLLPQIDLLANTTSLGMVGQPHHAFTLETLKPNALVTDIVYVPLETELLREARLRGHPTVGGLGMLLHQAAPGFEHWFGKRPSVGEALQRHVAADIRARVA